MTTRRYYVNNAPQLTLNASITSGATSCVISGTFTGWPTQFPYFASLDFGTASVEIVSVTNVVGTTATIVRGQGGTAAISHAAGATLDHVVVAQDLDEANAHTVASAGVHGISGSVVGTSDTQTLTNKTLSAPTVTGTLTGAAATWSGNVTVAGTSSVTGVSTAASYTANGNGTVTGVLTPKSYTNESAASTAIPSPVVGQQVWLTAPTTVGQVAGPFFWNGTVWYPVQFRGPVFLGYSATPPATVATATFTAIPIDTEILDTHGIHDTVTSNTQIKPNVPGYYRVSANIQWAANASGRRITSVWMNGSEQGVSRGECTPSGATGSTVGPVTSYVVQCNGTTDYIEVKGFQSSGGPLAMTLGVVEVEWLRP